MFKHVQAYYLSVCICCFRIHLVFSCCLYNDMKYCMVTSKEVFMLRESWASFACMLIVGVGKLQLTTSSTSLAPAAVPQQWWWRRSSLVTPHSGKLLGSLLPLLHALLYHCHGVDALCLASWWTLRKLCCFSGTGMCWSWCSWFGPLVFICSSKDGFLPSYCCLLVAFA
jgi:hypothetical protein